MTTRLIAVAILLSAVSSWADEPMPQVAPFTLDVVRAPPEFSKKDKEDLEKLLPMLVRAAKVEVPDAARLSTALTELKRQDCDRDDNCLAQLAKLAGSLYGLFIQLDYDIDGQVLRFQSKPTKKMTTLMVFNPAWLVPQGLRIPAGQTVTFSYADEPTRWAGGKPFNLHSVNLHMHERGLKGQVAILRANGTRECMLQIDNWDHTWQGDYIFVTPKRIEKGDRLLVSCTFDNSAEHQKIVGGVRQPAVDLDWSESKEMCVAFVAASQD